MDREEIALRKDWLAGWLGHVTRVEPTIGSTNGAPDVHLAWDGMTCWVEFKIADEHGNFALLADQRLWHRAYCAHSRNAIVCPMDKEGFWLIPSRRVIAPDAPQNTYALDAKKVKWSLLKENKGILRPIVHRVLDL